MLSKSLLNKYIHDKKKIIIVIYGANFKCNTQVRWYQGTQGKLTCKERVIILMLYTSL